MCLVTELLGIFQEGNKAVRVFTNTAVSLDGRIGPVDRSHVFLGSDQDRTRMSQLRAEADAVLVGGQTFRNWSTPCLEQPQDARGERNGPMINAVLTRQGLAAVDLSHWPHDEVRLIAFTGLDAPVPDEIEVVRHSVPTPATVLDHLASLGCESVLVEAGGDIIFQLLSSGRVDELFVTLTPNIIGGVGAPTLVDGVGFDAQSIQALQLVTAQTCGSEIFLHYRV